MYYALVTGLFVLGPMFLWRHMNRHALDPEKT